MILVVGLHLPTGRVITAGINDPTITHQMPHLFELTSRTRSNSPGLHDFTHLQRSERADFFGSMGCKEAQTSGSTGGKRSVYRQADREYEKPQQNR